MENNIIKNNIIASLLLQFVTIISGFVLPKIILLYFGSNINGLVSSINQFLNYVTLLEGGIGSVLMARLYKPLYQKDIKKISQIVNTTIHFFKILSIVYSVYVVVFAFVYPLVIDTPYSYSYTVVLVFVLALNLYFQYFLSISYKLLLNADKKVAFVSIIQSIIILLNLFGIIICVYFFQDIILIKAITAAVFIIQPIAFHLYVKKHYAINFMDGYDEYTIKHRWDGLGINTAYFIHSNTDIIVLTFFTTLSDVSIYAIYFLIVKALKMSVTAISSAIDPSFGSVLAKGDINESNSAFDYYEFGIAMITVLIFTCGMLLITPFVDIYTSGVTDANYHQPLFGILLVLSEMIYCYRDPYVAVAYAAGHIRQVSRFAYFEAAINIVISIFLVYNFGIMGVAIGTIIAMTYRMVEHIIYVKHNVLYRPIVKAVRSFCISLGCTVIPMTFTYLFIDMKVNNYLEWLWLAMKTFFIVIVSMLIINILFYKENFTKIVKRLK